MHFSVSWSLSMDDYFPNFRRIPENDKPAWKAWWLLADFDMVLVIFCYHSVASSVRGIDYNSYNFIGENILRIYLNTYLEHISSVIRIVFQTM